MHRFTGIRGMITMMGLAYAFSTNRRASRYKTVAWGSSGLQNCSSLFRDALGLRPPRLRKAGRGS